MTIPPSAVLCVRLCSGGKIVWFRGCTQITRVLRVDARNDFRCFTPLPAKALSDDISLTWKVKTAFNPFW